MVPTESRTGRQFQRYIHGCRQVVGCIPYRIRKSNQKHFRHGFRIEDIEVLLVSSQKCSRMMFPKGGWEIDETKEEAALRETVEEAGVDGLVGPTLGTWSFMSNSQAAYHEGHMFPMLVREQLDVWPEQNVRRRVWMSVKEAREVCVHLWMKEALDILVLRRKEEGNQHHHHQASCTVEFLRTEEAGRGINVAQSGEEEVDCCLVS